MTINQEMVSVYMQLKKTRDWSDEFFTKMMITCNVPRQIIAAFYDDCVKLGEMIPLEKMETVNEIREYVMKTTLSKSDRLELGKVMAFLNQFKINI